MGGSAFDEWGNLQYSDVISAYQYATNGIDMRDIKWNGYPGNDTTKQKCMGDVYTYKLTIETTCPFNIDYDVVCPEWGPKYETRTEKCVVITGPVSLVD